TGGGTLPHGLHNRQPPGEWAGEYRGFAGGDGPLQRIVRGVAWKARRGIRGGKTMMENETNTVFDSADTPAPEQLRGPAGTAMKPEERSELLAADEAQKLRSRWEKIQTGFVDEPRKSVQEADALVAQTTKQLAESFSRERNKLEQEW